MLPERFGRYEVLALIGDGAMGRVYSAWDPKVSRVVAVKTIKPELLTSETADDYLKRFRREAVAVGALSHPQVVRVFDIGDDYLVMELVEGRTLQALIREAGRIAPAETLRLIGPVAEALDQAHRAGIVHRDIKPANVIVQPDGQPKLMDFGVAHFASSVITVAGQVLGSPSYMAPEQIAGTKVTGRADVYSLAVVAYEMLTGQSPFQGKTITQVIYRVMHESAQPPRRLNAELPARYDDVFARALAKDPEQRYASASAFVGALDLRELEFVLEPMPDPDEELAPTTRLAIPTLEPGSTSVADEVATLLEMPEPSPRARRRKAAALPATLALAAALAVAGIGWAALRRGPEPALEPSPVRHAVSPTPVPSRIPVASPTAAAVSEVSVKAVPLAVRSAPSTPRLPAPAPPAPSAAPEPSPTAEPTPAPVVEGELVALDGDVTPPVRIRGGAAAYPEAARAMRLEGTVAVAMIVDEHGSPTELTVVESAGPVLDKAVLDAVRGWRFEPATKAGVRVKVRWTARQSYRSAR
jgi:serine/threonine-protein kinase